MSLFKHYLIGERPEIMRQNIRFRVIGRRSELAPDVIEEIEAGTNFLFINFANPDMVGHTANVPAIIEALEETDKQSVIDRLKDEIKRKLQFNPAAVSRQQPEIMINQLFIWSQRRI